MAVASNGNRIVSFGVFEVDMKAGELRRNGSKVRLQEQPFQVLAVLLEQPGEVVSREEMQNRLWPADTFVDFDHSLNAAIRRLRDALGDSAENPRFVETVARRGYRFLAPVNGVAQAAVPSPVAPTEPSTRNLGVLIAVGSFALILALYLGWWLGHRHSSASVDVSSPSLRRLTANPAEAPVISGVISPDGKYLAYADKTGVYLRQVATGETHAIQLPNRFDARPESWFPDGTHFVATWVAGPSEAPSLWSVSIVGGPPRKLADSGASPSVSPDGSQIAFLKGTASLKGRSSQEIWVMDADGGNLRQARASDGGLIGPPTWSPDGRRLVYVSGQYHGGSHNVDAEIQALDVQSGQPQTVLATIGLGAYVIWTPGNKLIYSVGERPPNQDDSNLWGAMLDPVSLHLIGQPVRLTSDPGSVATLSVTADGKRLAFFKHSIQPDVYVADVEAGGTRISSPRRLTLDERQDYPYTWTPDNKSVLFNSDRDGTFHLFRQDLDRANPDLLVGGNEQVVTPRLTPDGSNVLYLVTPKFDETTTEVRIMRMHLTGGPPQLVLKTSALNNHQCAVLPATTCLYSTMAGREIYFFEFDAFSGKTMALPQLTRREDDYYSFNWSLSPNGRTLATLKKTGTDRDAAIRLISITDNKERVLPVPGWAFINSIDWASDGKSVWISTATTQDTFALLNVSLNGQVRTMLQDKKIRIGWGVQSRDGRHLALWQASGTSNIWMLENF